MYKIQLPLGTNTVTAHLPSKPDWVVSPQHLPAVPNPKQAVAEALQQPLGLPQLPQLVKTHGKNVVLLVDDLTRSTPQTVILPVLLDALNAAGVKDTNITAIIANGTHRAMSAEEIVTRYGEEATQRIAFINHNAYDAASLVQVDNPNSNTPIFVNRLYYESDISIAVGNIVPHMYAGWAGGAKMVQPGVCGPVTTGETHYLAAENVRGILGVLDNPVRREIENVGKLTGLTMIVNTVLNAAQEIVAVVAGEPTLAHRAGVRMAERIYEVSIDAPCDLVIASAAPSDMDIWQSVKALNGSAMAVGPGGVLILCSASPAGVSPDHPEFVALGTSTLKQANEAFSQGQITDKVALSTYLALRLNLDQVRTILVSQGVSAVEACRLGFDWAPDLQAAVDRAYSILSPSCRTGVITHGADIYVRRKSQQGAVSDAINT